MARILDVNGNSYYPDNPEGSYFANISVRHIAADAAGSFVWAMRNPVASTKNIHIRAIRGAMWFDGTAVAAANVGYELCYFNGGDPTTGTTVPRHKKVTTTFGSYTAYPASQILDANIQQKSGILTITGIAGIEIIHVMRMGAAVTNGLRPFDLDFTASGQRQEFKTLAPGDGIGIRLTVAAIIGLGIAGSFEWDEKS